MRRDCKGYRTEKNKFSYMVLDLCKLLNTVYIYEHFDYETYLGMVVVELKSDRGNVKYRGNWEENNDS